MEKSSYRNFNCGNGKKSENPRNCIHFNRASVPPAITRARLSSFASSHPSRWRLSVGTLTDFRETVVSGERSTSAMKRGGVILALRRAPRRGRPCLEAERDVCSTNATLPIVFEPGALLRARTTRTPGSTRHPTAHASGTRPQSSRLTQGSRESGITAETMAIFALLLGRVIDG